MFRVDPFRRSDLPITIDRLDCRPLTLLTGQSLVMADPLLNMRSRAAGIQMDCFVANAHRNDTFDRWRNAMVMPYWSVTFY